MKHKNAITQTSFEGFYSNIAYERQYLAWCSNPKMQAGVNWQSAFWGGFLTLCIWPLTLLRFTVAQADKVLSNLTGGVLVTSIPISEFPVGKKYFSILALYGDEGFDYLAVRFSGVFDGITATIRWTALRYC